MLPVSILNMARKTIILVRHGQYTKASEHSPEKLTTLGKKQASYVAKRLKEYQIDRIVHSTMPRAVETANLIKAKLEFPKLMESCDSLRECVPGFPKHLQKEHGYTDQARLKRDQKQLDQAFKKYFKIPTRDSVEVLVCHGNVIRYLVCKTLGVDTLAWRKMDIQQCAISIVEIESRGSNNFIVLSHNDVGHIPKGLRTFL